MNQAKVNPPTWGSGPFDFDPAFFKFGENDEPEIFSTYESLAHAYLSRDSRTYAFKHYSNGYVRLKSGRKGGADYAMKVSGKYYHSEEAVLSDWGKWCREQFLWYSLEGLADGIAELRESGEDPSHLEVMLKELEGWKS